MPYTLKPNKIFAKDPNGDGYLPQNVVTDQSTTEQVALINSTGASQVSAIQTKGEQTLASIPEDYTALSGEVTDLKRFFVNSLENKKPLFAENFSVGNISISGSGWTYLDNSKRVRTNEGYTLRLYPGEKISLSDYTDARMYIGWQRLDGVYNTSGGWLTNDFTVFDSGNYVILLSNITEKVQSDVNALLSLLSITQNGAEKPTAFDEKTFIVANHQGYTATAPNNTLPAFTMSKIMGFDTVETDVRFTSDNIPVLSHDDDISSHSNGTGNISQMTYEQLSQYDFGAWKNPIYTGTKIPTFAEFLALCRSLNLNAYVELKVCDNTQANILSELVKEYGMEKHITWIGVASLLKYIVSKMPYSRIGIIVGTDDAVDVIETNYLSLLSKSNDVFIDVQYGVYTRNNYYNTIIAIGCPVEVWTLDAFDYFTTQEKAKNVTGVTTNTMLFDQLALNDATSPFDPNHYKVPTIKAFTDLIDGTT